jgi:Lon protease-like protein
MFPLGSVLLPAMPLPLRIFEQRYLKLLGDLVASEKPEFGVVLIERGKEVGGGGKRMSIGTIASVTEIGTTQEFLGLESFGNYWLLSANLAASSLEPTSNSAMIQWTPAGRWLGCFQLAHWIN